MVVQMVSWVAWPAFAPGVRALLAWHRRPAGQTP